MAMADFLQIADATSAARTGGYAFCPSTYFTNEDEIPSDARSVPSYEITSQSAVQFFDEQCMSVTGLPESSSFLDPHYDLGLFDDTEQGSECMKWDIVTIQASPMANVKTAYEFDGQAAPLGSHMGAFYHIDNQTQCLEHCWARSNLDHECFWPNGRHMLETNSQYLAADRMTSTSPQHISSNQTTSLLSSENVDESKETPGIDPSMSFGDLLPSLKSLPSSRIMESCPRNQQVPFECLKCHKTFKNQWSLK